MTAIYGTVTSDGPVTIAMPVYTGRAAVTAGVGGREVVYYGKAPPEFPVTLKIEGVEAVATGKMLARVAGFAVLWVPDVP
jgi:hypothetical protein